MKTNRNTTSQTKWQGLAPDINKTTNQAQKFTKDQNHKTNNKHHESILMVPSASKGKLNLILLQDFMEITFSMKSHALYYHKHINSSA